MQDRTYDVVLVGGGLANALIAARLAALRPEVSWILLEAKDRLFGHGGDQTWSFHEGDVGQDLWVKELVTKTWAGYDVAFPGLVRAFASPYHSVRADGLRRHMTPLLGDRVHCRTKVRDVAGGVVTLGDNMPVRGDLVIDGRGFGDGVPYACGFQKFVGLHLRLAADHGLLRPRLKDARVEQTDGYRFVYALPWSPREILLEDTYYSDEPHLDEERLARGLRAYAAAQGWRIDEVLSRERGVLPIPLAGSGRPAFAGGVLAAGVAAGRFHPTTGYSFMYAARLATAIAALPRFDAQAATRLNGESARLWDRGDFYRRLNNMLFRAAAPSARWRVMERFYQRSADLIERFYAGHTTDLDRLRMLSGRPPVPVVRGLRAFAARFDGERSSLA